MSEEENRIFTNNVKTALVNSKSEYLRKLAINQVILSKLDTENFIKFLRVAGELGKLIGLLRIFIMEYELTPKNEQLILDIINDVNNLKEELIILSDKIK